MRFCRLLHKKLRNVRLYLKMIFQLNISAKNSKIDGETTDLIADVLLECIYDISSRESVNAVCKIAKKVTEENGGDTIETLSKMKEIHHRKY